MFKLDRQFKCSSCITKAKDCEIIRCTVCEFDFHAVCESDEGKSTDGIANRTFIGAFKKPSVKKNFTWKCDTCLTISEQNQAATVKESITQLVNLVTQLKAQLPEQIKSIVKEELDSLKQPPDIEELSTSIASKIQMDPVQPPDTPWTDVARVKNLKENIKSSILVKPDKDGRPVDRKYVRKLAIDNGVPVSKIVVTDTGDTFINLPNQQSQEKLRPLLPNVNNVVVLKSKLPSIRIMSVTDELSKEEIKDGLSSQNPTIGKLVQDGEELEVIYTRAPPPGKDFHQVTVRVSPLIRKVIKSLGDHVFLGGNSCRIEDSFHVKRCNSCQRFGHYAAKCTPDNPVICGFCTENHNSDDCELKNSHSREHTCFNCRTAEIENFKGHSTFSRKCPAYIVQQKKLESSISYLN